MLRVGTRTPAWLPTVTEDGYGKPWAKIDDISCPRRPPRGEPPPLHAPGVPRHLPPRRPARPQRTPPARPPTLPSRVAGRHPARVGRTGRPVPQARTQDPPRTPAGRRPEGWHGLYPHPARPPGQRSPGPGGGRRREDPPRG